MSEIDGDRTGQETGVARRRVLATAGTLSLSVPLIAGCSGGDGGNETDDSNDEADDTVTPTTEPQTETGTESSDVSGTTASRVEQLSIVDHRPRIGYFGDVDQTYFPVEVTVENRGDQQSDVTEYYFNVVVFDADGNDVSRDRLGTSASGETAFGPGEQRSLVVWTTTEVEPSEIDRYEVTIVCVNPVNDFEADGVYCQ